MRFINTDGMAFIGPGSEWFWTAISGLILIVTFIAIYRQLRIMRSAGALDQLESFEAELNSERMVRFELEVLLALRDGADARHLPRAAAAGIWRFWEKTGALARQGHLDPKLLWEGSGTNARSWWAVLGPYAKEWRAEQKQPTFLVNFEWLANVMAQLDHRDGPAEPLGGGPGHLFNSPEALSFACDQREERLRIEEQLRAIPVVATPRPAASSSRPRRPAPKRDVRPR